MNASSRSALAEIRIAAGFTSALALAFRTRLARGTIYNAEAGSGPLGLAGARRIAIACHVTVETVMRAYLTRRIEYLDRERRQIRATLTRFKACARKPRRPS